LVVFEIQIHLMQFSFENGPYLKKCIILY